MADSIMRGPAITPIADHTIRVLNRIERRQVELREEYEANERLEQELRGVLAVIGVTYPPEAPT